MRVMSSLFCEHAQCLQLLVRLCCPAPFWVPRGTTTCLQRSVAKYRSAGVWVLCPDVQENSKTIIMFYNDNNNALSFKGTTMLFDLCIYC